MDERLKFRVDKAGYQYYVSRILQSEERHDMMLMLCCYLAQSGQHAMLEALQEAWKRNG